MNIFCTTLFLQICKNSYKYVGEGQHMRVMVTFSHTFGNIVYDFGFNYNSETFTFSNQASQSSSMTVQ